MCILNENISKILVQVSTTTIYYNANDLLVDSKSANTSNKHSSLKLNDDSACVLNGSSKYIYRIL